MKRACSTLALPVTVALAAGGCALSAENSSLALPKVSDAGAAVAKVASAASEALKPAPRPVGTPTEVYTRVARGVLTCWFGSNGPLKPDYIYHAEAAPPSKGGASTIDVRSRETSGGTDPRSLLAWRATIAPNPEGPQVTIENSRLPAHWAERLESDVHRWASAEEGCGEGPVTAGWTAEDQPPAKVPVANKPKR